LITLKHFLRCNTKIYIWYSIFWNMNHIGGKKSFKCKILIFNRYIYFLIVCKQWTHTIDTLQHHSLSLTSSAVDHSTTSTPYVFCQSYLPFQENQNVILKKGPDCTCGIHVALSRTHLGMMNDINRRQILTDVLTKVNYFIL
jgi:hypothetical protein